MHERAGKVETAAHAARERPHDAVGSVGEREVLEQLVDARPDVGRRHVRELPDHLEVLAPSEVLVDGGGLAGQADRAAHAVRVLGDVDPEHLARYRHREGARW